MRYVIGIDLGSTTTKAIVLSERGQLLGRGITNTRSNYDAACAIARTEALIAARFAVFRDALEQAAPHGAGELIAGLQRSFRLVQYRKQLRALRAEMEQAAAGTWHTLGSALGDAALGLLDQVEAQAPADFESSARGSSEFFRDLAGGRYRRLAEESAAHKQVGFDYLLAYFDKAIVKVENQALDLSFESNFEDAVAACLERHPATSREQASALSTAAEESARQPLEEAAKVGTGYGRQKLPFAKEEIRSEILCHGLGAHWMFPDTRTVLDIGGQDTKAIQVDDSGIVTSFQMNDRCAAGCGRYLGYIADEMNIAVQDLGPLAESARRAVKINSTCTVFAGAELRDRLAMGQRRADVVAGLHRAIVLRAMSLLARSGGVHDEFTFTGGVASNQAAVRALRDLIRENYGDLTMNISPDSIYTGALGAALMALRTVSPAREESDDHRGNRRGVERRQDRSLAG